ncbi:hypothetical protein RWE15_18580 [Virgibacillus halophilus]|uniref:Uncharacterized protein n=1 Tax=Tigheibacillus halophilus TaxID=361280 RepID=A0ABU5C9K7_9BACI|nr:hypothetical protein [Virgibacillus halophilus]
MKRIVEAEKQFHGWQQRVSDIDKALEKNDASKETLEEEMTVYQSEMKRLFQTAQVEDEEAYYKAAEQSQSYENLKKGKPAFTKAIFHIFS